MHVIYFHTSRHFIYLLHQTNQVVKKGKNEKQVAKNGNWSDIKDYLGIFS